MAQTIVTGSINKQVYDMIRSKILEREYLPGERIDPKAIAEEFSISMMPVRDALRNLSTDGLVVTKERIGFFVRDFSADEIAEIYESRMMFELYCLEHHMKAVEEEALDALANRLKKAKSGKELLALDFELHGMWVKASGNSFLLQQYQDMNALFSLGVQGGYESNLERARKEHIEILEAVKEDKPEKALTLLKKHLETARNETVEIYSGYRK